MRIAYLCQYFHPEPAAPSARLLEFGRAWQQLGHEVVVITGFPNHPTGVVPPRYQGRLIMEDEVDGLRVLRSWLYATPNRGVGRKSLNHLSFALSSALLALPRLGPVDVVIASSPSLLSVMSALAIARAQRVPLIFEVRDLWPAAMADLKVVRGRPVLRALEWLELALYRAAAHVVVVTHGFADNLVARGVLAEKISVIPNGADTDFFRPMPGDSAFRAAHKLDDKFVVAYLGAHGISHGLEVVLDAAARHVNMDAAVRYLLVGDGAQREALLASRVRMKLDNVLMLSSQPRTQMPGLYSAADVCLVLLKAQPLFRTFVPSKMFEIMAAGRPIIANVEGEARDILERSGAAMLVAPGDGGALAQAVAALAGDERRRRSMGEAGRAFVLQHYDRGTLARRYAELLECVASGAQGRIGSRVERPVNGAAKRGR